MTFKELREKIEAIAGTLPDDTPVRVSVDDIMGEGDLQSVTVDNESGTRVVWINGTGM